MKHVYLLLFSILLSSSVIAQVQPIQSIRGNDADGIPLSLGDTVTVEGVIFSPDFDGGSGYEFYIQDDSSGILIYGDSVPFFEPTFRHTVQIEGAIEQIQGRTYLKMTDLVGISTTPNTTKNPITRVGTFPMNESHEPFLIEYWGCFTEYEPFQNWSLNSNIDFLFDIRLSVSSQILPITLNVDGDTDVSTSYPGDGWKIGLAWQVDTVPPYDSIYHLRPRFSYDIATFCPSVSNVEYPQAYISPNPASNILFVEAEQLFDTIEVFDINGSLVFSKQISKSTSIDLDIDSLPRGLYTVSLSSNLEIQYINKFIKI